MYKTYRLMFLEHLKISPKPLTDHESQKHSHWFILSRLNAKFKLIYVENRFWLVPIAPQPTLGNVKFSIM